MSQKVFSAWWVVYTMDPKTGNPVFLVVKRLALSKKIERVAPKWKIQQWETEQQAALREIEEEVWLDRTLLKIKKKLDTVSLQLYSNDGTMWINKDITYFLVEYMWDRTQVQVCDSEWYTWMYTRWDIKKMISLVTYKDIRELYRKWYHAIKELQTKELFIKTL